MSVQIEWDDLIRGRGPVAARHRFVDDGAALAAVLDPAVNLCVWRRAIGTRLARWMEGVRDGCDLRAQEELAGAAPDGSSLVSSLPACTERDELQRDMEGLAARYAAMLGAPRVLASLAVVSDDMCRKFHVDRVGIRALCTYSGPGTEWVPEHAVLRTGLDREAESLASGNRSVVPNAAEVCALEVGWVGLLKGSEWPGNAWHGVVHRSPPVGSVGLRRVLFKLDLDPERRLRDR
jgi:hypothetical protein